MTSDSALARAYVDQGRSDDCPVINTHAHFGPYSGIYFPRHQPEAVVATMQRCGIRWLIASHHSALIDTDRGNREYARIMARYPDHLRGYWAINPTYPQRVVDEVAAYDQQSGFVGFKFLADYYQYPITGDNHRPALEFANERQLPILMHTWGGSPYDGPDEVEKVARQYPQAIFLMGHAGYGEWDKASRLARDYPNVYLELTAAYSVRGALETMIRIAGSERILFGDDHPWFTPLYGIGCILFARMTDEDRHNILWRNAARLFKLPVGE